MIAREENFDDGDGFDDEVPGDVDEIDTTDAAGWKHFDRELSHFASEPRNVRLGLALDGFNPFENMSTAYSMWLVVLIPYNLPPWKCMKESNFFMSLLVPGPKSPGKEIDTINDFPSYGDLSGWSMKGYQACPTCKEDTSSFGIKGKISFMGHRHYLPSDHIWRRSRQHDGKPERRSQSRTKKRERGVRGYGRNIELDKFVKKHGKVKIEINEEEGKPVTTFAPKIALGIGTAVRNTILLSCENWKAIPMDVKELMIDRSETHFEFDPTTMIVRKYLDEKMQNIFREFRAGLHKYYCKFDDFIEARANPPDKITHEDWNMMCDRWETDAWKKKQETNKRSRSAVKFNHVIGAKSFLQVRHELEKKKGCDVDEVEVFQETHFREKEGWINDKAKDAYRIIAESTEAGVQTISSAKACKIVLGSHSMQIVNLKSGESLGSNVSSTREKEKNEMAYLKEVNEKLTHELAKWEQRWTDIKKEVGSRGGRRRGRGS
ncbi:transposase [Cucumis melo var. makuwa]|uniref:Transposase n=1 Tax=Cucumis melo var. makuwa TaxID=1194695 RepID=A0A5A7SPZ3_CUCMM|nr:transposase [Cucumis melo var. makuwa]